MSETPRVDAKEKETEEYTTPTGAGRHAHYGWKMARQLERELSALRVEHEQLRLDAKEIAAQYHHVMVHEDSMHEVCAIELRDAISSFQCSPEDNETILSRIFQIERAEG